MIVRQLTDLAATANREALHRSLVEYATEWTGLARADRPDLEHAEAQAAVHCVLTLVRFLSQMPAPHGDWRRPWSTSDRRPSAFAAPADRRDSRQGRDLRPCRCVDERDREI
ncbi:hypothetical protein [Streptomyces sp. NPDC002785]|uniref:hypothetical protein n=1 Tax=Streptomyces sp. NPDC002785 TaxID=3154543 RepID=UPI00333258CB